MTTQLIARAAAQCPDSNSIISGGGPPDEGLFNIVVPEGGPSNESPTARFIKLIKNAQEFDPQYRWIISRLHVRTQLLDASLALVLGSLPQHYSIDVNGLLRYVDRVLVPKQESIRA